MPSNATERQANLLRLCTELEVHAQSLQRAFQPAEPASTLSAKLSLTHSRSQSSFIRICQDRCLSSRAKLETEGKIKAKPGCAEVAVGTSDEVFFYVAPFRYPNTSCGILFAHSLEADHTATAKATRFDSGGLLHPLKRPDPAEPVSDYLARHELPSVDHRRYLSHALTALFRQPEDYLEGLPPLHPSPLGLTGGDARAWTHELRLPERVPLSGNIHLKALFLTATVANDPAVEAVLTWCQQEGVDIIFLPTVRNGGFTVLQQRCLQYLRRELYP